MPKDRDPITEWALAADDAARAADADVIELASAVHEWCESMEQAFPEAPSALREVTELLRRTAAEAEGRAARRRSAMKARQALIEARALSK